jgi:outer membrane receptor protein involved in Fe transport
MVSTLTATYADLQQSIGQQQQVSYTVVNGASTCTPASTFRTYQENSLIHLPQLKYAMRAAVRGWLITAGASGGLIAPEASVAQPTGQLSPFSASSYWSDAGNFRRSFASGQESLFLQVNRALAERWGLMAGVRAEGYALDGGRAIEPRISLLYRLNHRQTLHASWNSSSQLPPTMDLISYGGNRNLPPIEVHQFSAGLRLWQADWGTLDADAYTKQYRNEPVSTQYPQLMLFNMVDTLGQSFAWLPLTGTGTAGSRGVEIALRAHWRSRFDLLASATRSQSDYRALDRIRRPENYDTPLAVNSMVNLRLPLGITLNSRETLASGRVYCPFDVTDSLVQNRGIYNLARINTVRGPLYNRLDAELERHFKLGKGAIDLRGGAENILNRGNLLGYVWLGNCALSASCMPGAPPVAKLDQIGRFPVLSASYQF